MQSQDEKLGAPPIPYGPYAVGEALAMAGRILKAVRAKLDSQRIGLEPEGATR
jgi:hypothetical protein